MLGAVVGAGIDLAFGRRFAKAPRLVLTVVTHRRLGRCCSSTRCTSTQAAVLPAEGDRNIGRPQHRPAPPPHAVRRVPVPGRLPAAVRLPRGLRHRAGSRAARRPSGSSSATPRFGAAIRASAENAERASLLGIGTGRIGTDRLGRGRRAGAAATRCSPPTPATPAGSNPPGSEFLFPPLAAAVLGQVPRPAHDDLRLVLHRDLQRGHQPTRSGAAPATVVHQRRCSSCSPSVASSCSARTCSASSRRRLVRGRPASEPRPDPEGAPEVGGLRVARYLLIVAALAVVVGLPFVAPTRFQVLGSGHPHQHHRRPVPRRPHRVGRPGQPRPVRVRRRRRARRRASSTRPGSVWYLAVPIAVIATAAVAFVLGLPALRIKGLFLAGATFGVRRVHGGVHGAAHASAVATCTTGLDPAHPGVHRLRRRAEHVLPRARPPSCSSILVIAQPAQGAASAASSSPSARTRPTCSRFGVKVVRTKLYAFCPRRRPRRLRRSAARGPGPRRSTAHNFGAAAEHQPLHRHGARRRRRHLPGALLGSAYQNMLTYFFAGQPHREHRAPRRCR